MLSFKRVQFLLKEYENDKLLKLPPVPFIVKAPEWASALQSGFKIANYRQLECIWTVCATNALYTCRIGDKRRVIYYYSGSQIHLTNVGKGNRIHGETRERYTSIRTKTRTVPGLHRDGGRRRNGVRLRYACPNRGPGRSVLVAVQTRIQEHNSINPVQRARLRVTTLPLNKHSQTGEAEPPCSIPCPAR